MRDIAEWGEIGGMGPRIVGSGTSVADVLQEWVAETDVDGFNLAYAITPGSFADFVDHVVPVLTARGAYQPEYAPGTLRNKLFGSGDRLPDEHRGRPVPRRRSVVDDHRAAVHRALVVGLGGIAAGQGEVALPCASRRKSAPKPACRGTFTSARADVVVCSGGRLVRRSGCDAPTASPARVGSRCG